MRRLLTLIGFLLVLILSTLNFNEVELLYGPPFEARVIGVADGDTLTIKRGIKREKIRLYGIDCPEKLQEWGTEAQLFTSSMTESQVVAITPVNQDRYGRTVAYVVLQDGTNLNYALVSNGLAWWYRQYARNNLQLSCRELRARMEHQGLWCDDDPTPPWVFRKGVSVNKSTF